MEYLTITNILIGVTVVISAMALQNREMMSKLLFVPTAVNHQKEYYRYISSGFIHGSWMHLAFNMFVLWSFGNIIEQIFSYEQVLGKMGNLAYLAMYFIGMIVADIPTYLKHKDNYQYASLGASGAVSAVLFSYILISPLSGLMIFPIPIEIPAIIFGVLYLGYSLYAASNVRDNINHDAHFYGAVLGIVFTIAIHPSFVGGFINQITNALGAG